MIEVRFEEHEIRRIGTVASERQAQNLVRNRKDVNNCPKDQGWDFHVIGAAGECAVAKWFDRYWSGNLGHMAADDVGDWQVRTRSEHHYDLILKANDRDDRAFILVTGRPPKMLIHGWLWGREGKQERFWRDPKGGRPAFFIPQNELRPIETLKTATEAIKPSSRLFPDLAAE